MRKKKEAQPSAGSAVPVPAMTDVPPQPTRVAATSSRNELSEISEKLDRILIIMKHHERRERLRGVMRTLHSFIWLALVIGSSWYFYAYGPELMAKIAESAARSASKVAQENSTNMMEKVQQKLPQDLLQLLR